jgi:hypothetical protein
MKVDQRRYYALTLEAKERLGRATDEDRKLYRMLIGLINEDDDDD